MHKQSAWKEVRECSPMLVFLDRILMFLNTYLMDMEIFRKRGIGAAHNGLKGGLHV